MSLLETRKLTVRFGGVVANNGIDLEVKAGQIVGLIGPNGAGKTTFIDAITGYVTSTGEVRLGDTNVSGLRAHQLARRGLVRTFQSLELFEDLSVADNLYVAAQRPRWYHSILEMLHIPTMTATERANADDAMTLVGISEFRDRLPSDLSHGQRKLVGMARAVAAKPQLILLDEPAAGLDTTESHQLGAQIKSLPDNGITVLLIDHDMGLVLSVCDYIYVLDFGAVIAQGTPAEIRTNPSVIEAYLGESAGAAQEASAAAIRAESEGATSSE